MAPGVHLLETTPFAGGASGDGGSTCRLPFAELWRRLSKREWWMVANEQGEGQCSALLDLCADPVSFSRCTVSLTERVLCGESPKVLAASLKMSASRVNQQVSSVLRGMGAPESPTKVSILFVMAALAAQGVEVPPAHLEATERPGRVRIRARVPGYTFHTRLSSGECEVVRLLIESKTYAQIASMRGTTVRTVANQLCSAFRKLRISGQGELRVRAVLELAQFTGPRGGPPSGDRLDVGGALTPEVSRIIERDATRFQLTTSPLVW